MDKGIVDKLKRMLENAEIDGVLGFKNRTYPDKNIPFFATNPDEIDFLSNSRFNMLNIATYLKKLKGKKIAVMVRGCEERAINVLCAENQLNRKDIILVGLPCKGIVDMRKLEEAYGEKILSIEEDTGKIKISGKGGDKTIDVKNILSNSCLTCERPVAETADIKVKGDAINTFSDYQEVKSVEDMPFDKRQELFEKEFFNCIRCYACRDACPMCYCETCFVDSNNPVWVEPGRDITDIIAFHLIRMFHMAGRCTNCGACERACPSGINLTYFTAKITKDMKDSYDFIAGLTTQQNPALGEFKQNDREDFIL